MKKQTNKTSRTTSVSSVKSTTSMSNQELLSFYRQRSRRGDLEKIAKLTNYSSTHISNVKSGRRSINSTIAKAMYKVSSKRKVTTA